MFGLFGKKKKEQSAAIQQKTVEAPRALSSVEVEGTGMRLQIGNAQHQGQRDYQEDSFGMSDMRPEALSQKGFLAVLADGMGGLSNGKEISQKAISTILEWFNSPTTRCENAETMKKFVADMNSRLCSAFGNSGRLKSGTTLVMALVKDGFLHWLCVGDSRLYLKRGGKLYQVNEDHDYLNQLLDDVIDGRLTMAKAFGDRQKDSLAACIGKSDLSMFDYSKNGFALQDGDTLLLCSDGVYNALGHDELAQNIAGNPMADAERIKNLVQAKRVPHQDNNTLIIVTYN